MSEKVGVRRGNKEKDANITQEGKKYILDREKRRDLFERDEE